MNRQIAVDLVVSAQDLVDVIEQVAAEGYRTATRLKGAALDIRATYEVVAPFIEWLKSK